MNKKGIFITLAVILVAAVAYITGSMNKNNDQVTASGAELPTYFLMKQTINSNKSDYFLYDTDAEIKKVEKGDETKTAELSNSVFENPFNKLDGYKNFIAENSGLSYYVLTDNGELSQLSVDPFSEIYTSAEYIVRGKTTSTTPIPIKDGTFDSLEIQKIGPGTTQNYSPGVYGDYTEINYLGVSQNGDALYFFVDNEFPGSNDLNAAVVKQNPNDVKDFDLLVSTSSDNDTAISPTKSLGVLGVSQNMAYIKHYKNNSNGNYDEGDVTIEEVDFVTGEVTTLDQVFKANDVFMLSRDRSYLVSRSDLSISMEEPTASIYSLPDGKLVRTFYPATCNNLGIDQSGRYVAQICLGIGEYQILDTTDGTRYTISKFDRPVDDSGYEVGYSETSFVMFEYIPE